jgi:hypothetical protein
MKWLTLVVALLVALFVINCGSDKKCDTAGTCAATGNTIKVCCDDSDHCTITGGSQEVTCTGVTDCQTAAAQVVTSCSAT